MRIKQTIKRLMLTGIAALYLAVAGTMAQTNYFRIKNGIPHLPVYANTTDVVSPLPGSLVFTTTDNKPMLYNGQVWDDFCSQLLPEATGSKTFFAIIDGVPVMPVKTAVTGASTSGDFYWPLNGRGLMVNNGTTWTSPANMPATLPATSATTIIGTSAQVTGGFVLPVLAADPAGVEQGAIYMNSVSKKPVVYDGTAWTTLPCLCSPIVSAGVDVNAANINPLAGYYSFYQKDNLLETATGIVKNWYLADDANGANKALVATGDTWSGWGNSMNGKYIQYEVLTKTTTGLLGMGASAWTKLYNCPPQISDPNIYPATAVFTSSSINFMLEYCYFDKEENAEGTPSIKWYLADDANGTNMVLKASSVDYNYTFNPTDQNKYLLATITPVAATGYTTGDLKQVLPARTVKIFNCPPQGAAPGFGDNSLASATLTGYYAYYDREENAEGTSTFEWWQANDAAGSGATLVGTAATYSLATDADYNKYYSFRVIPVATVGYLSGDQVSSAYTLVANCPPQATGVRIDGTLTVGSTLQVGYAYYDKEAQVEGASVIQWYRDNTSTPIAGATASSYVLTAADQGHTIGAGITPKATVGYSTGSETVSAFTTTIP